MKNLNYLSKEFIEIDSEMEHRIFVDFAKYKKEKGWNDCAISNLEAGRSWNYYLINLENSKTIAIGKRSACQLRKIEKGMFKGCYCVIEAHEGGDKFTLLYVLDKNKVLNYPQFNEVLTAEQVDNLFDRNNIEKMTAKVLNQFDITKRHQAYEGFCEALPDRCWRYEHFSKNVLYKFEKEGEIDLQTKDIDKSFVNLEMCKDASRNYFKALSKKKEQEKTL